MNIDQIAINMIASALAKHFVSMYYVEIETGHFVECVPSRIFGVSDLPAEGEDFFALAKENAHNFVNPDDLKEMKTMYSKTAILNALSKTNPLIYDCRFEENGKVTHVRHVTFLCDDNKHLLCCLENIDKEYKAREKQKKELLSAERMAWQDELTGIRNRNSYLEHINSLDKNVKSDTYTRPFGVVVCDVNNLKHINDTRGHSFGDEAIQKASRMVCETFKHSPVFRTGGDEFVAILTDIDYEQRDELLEKLRAESLANGRTRSGPEVASGLSVYDPVRDKSYNEVFERADFDMYENKKMLKARSAVQSVGRTDGGSNLITDERRRLLDSLFGAMYTIAGEGYVYLNDLRYDYSRWSMKLVNDFGLKSEYMYHADKIWHDYIHPDDVEKYDEAVEAVLRGNMELRPLLYRARRADGTYATLSTRGFVLTDKDGNPEYFGGIIIEH